jgi:hypothetical protein
MMNYERSMLDGQRRKRKDERRKGNDLATLPVGNRVGGGEKAKVAKNTAISTRHLAMFGF